MFSNSWYNTHIKDLKHKIHLLLSVQWKYKMQFDGIMGWQIKNCNGGGWNDPYFKFNMSKLLSCLHLVWLLYHSCFSPYRALTWRSDIACSQTSPITFNNLKQPIDLQMEDTSFIRQELTLNLLQTPVDFSPSLFVQCSNQVTRAHQWAFCF